MRNYESLIKLARFRTDELQKQVGVLQQSREELNAKITQLDASVPEEQVAAAASREGFVAYGSYAQAVIKRKQNLRASIDEVDGHIAKIRSELEVAFGELKKYELMEERRLAQVKASAKKREQDQLDDIAQIRAAS